MGVSAKAPEERFREHKTRARNRTGRIDLANDEVHDHGVRLLPQYYAHLHPSCSHEAKRRERALALHLHAKGFKVAGDGVPPEMRR